MKATPLQKRAARRARNTSMVDMNLVSLIDVFTILIFFLLSSAGVEAALPHTTHGKAVRLPLSTADKAPRETLVLVLGGDEIQVDGRRVAGMAEALAMPGDVIPALLAELELQAPSEAGAAGNGQAAKAITILGDKAIPYRLLRKVMVTSARARFTDVSFAVQRKNER